MASSWSTTAAAIAGGLSPLAFGVAFFARPSLIANIFPLTLPLASASQQQASADTYTLLLGAREIAYGLFFLAVWNKTRSSSREVRAVARELLGLGMLTAVVFPIGDFLAVRYAKSEGVLSAEQAGSDLPFVLMGLIFAGIGGSLLGWFGGKVKSA